MRSWEVWVEQWEEEEDEEFAAESWCFEAAVENVGCGCTEARAGKNRRADDNAYVYEKQ